MYKYIIVVVLSTIVLSSCRRDWREEEIAGKLHAIFPRAASVRILDSSGLGDKEDIFSLPKPVFKAFVKGSDKDSIYSFIFYFYRKRILDTSLLNAVLGAVVKQDLRVGLRTNTAGYVLSLPQFDSSGSNILVYAASLYAMDHFTDSIENDIRRYFRIARDTSAGIKLEEVRQTRTMEPPPPPPPPITYPATKKK